MITNEKQEKRKKVFDEYVKNDFFQVLDLISFNISHNQITTNDAHANQGNPSIIQKIQKELVVQFPNTIPDPRAVFKK